MPHPRSKRNRSTTARNYQFAQIPNANIPRSKIKRNFSRKMNIDKTLIYPCFTDEVLPGDTISLGTNVVGRIPTLLNPIMSNIFVDVFFFAVPKRILHTDFVKMMGEQDNPGDSVDFVAPHIQAPAGGYLEDTLYDHLGIPPGVDTLRTNAYFTRAYAKIWNDWFRSEDLQDSAHLDVDAGPDDPADYELLPRGKRHDYFTSCLPSPQKGDSVLLPLGQAAPVLGIGKIDQTYGSASTTVYETGQTSSTTFASSQQMGDSGGTNFHWHLEEDPSNAGYPAVWADLSNATAATINQLRQAFALQKLLERDQRGGTRYQEVLRSHFRVSGPDARLQRSEFLGGGTFPVITYSVAKTTKGTGTNNVGDLGAYGLIVGQAPRWNRSFTEHCVVMGLISLRADLEYQQGLHRMFTRGLEGKYDYYWPAFAHLGEQGVENREIYAQGGGAPASPDTDIFGYNERWSEYKYRGNECTGAMRSTHSTPLDVWHLGQEFLSLPVLDDTFIQEDPPIDRVVSVVGASPLIVDLNYEYTHVRPMPVRSVPGLIDHF